MNNINLKIIIKLWKLLYRTTGTNSENLGKPLTNNDYSCDTRISINIIISSLLETRTPILLVIMSLTVISIKIIFPAVYSDAARFVLSTTFIEYKLCPWCQLGMEMTRVIKSTAIIPTSIFFIPVDDATHNLFCNKIRGVSVKRGIQKLTLWKLLYNLPASTWKNIHVCDKNTFFFFSKRLYKL